MQNLAEVWLWDKMVGALAWSPDIALATFEYTPEWISTGVQIAPLRMPSHTEGARIFQFPQLNRDTYKGLPACFADTLPDDFGNAVINAWRAMVATHRVSIRLSDYSTAENAAWAHWNMPLRCAKHNLFHPEWNWNR